MRILWINERADFVGGAERYIADAASHLREQGHVSELLYGVEGWMEPTFTSRFDAAFPMVDVARQIRELRPDVVFVHQLRDLDATRAVTSSGAPSIRYFHDHRLFCLREHKYKTLSRETCTDVVGTVCYSCLGFVTRDKDRKLRLRTLSSIRTEQEAQRGFSLYMVGSDYMRAHVAAHGFDEHRIVVNPPVVEIPPDSTRIVERQANELLFVGALLRGKGLDVLIDAMPQIRRAARLRVIGKGAQEDELRALARDRGVADRIEWVGNATRDELAEAYARAACLVVPSRTPETFGLTGPEALLHQTPVVASQVGGMGEWLEEGETGLSFPSGDSVALAVAIERVLVDPQGAERRAIAGKTMVLREFSPPAHAARLVAALERAVSE